MEVRMIVTGTRPMLMHNVQLASPMNRYAQELKRLNGAKKSSTRTDDDRMEIARVEWEGGLYFDEAIGPYVPSSWVFRNLLGAARQGRRGKLIEGGVLVKELMHPVMYDGPRTIEEMWDGGASEFVDFRSVRVGAAKVDRCRPIFPEWSIEAILMVDTSVVDFEAIGDIAVIGGAMHGYGDFRQQYGRFEVDIEIIKDKDKGKK